MGNILKETCNGHEIHSTYDLLGRRTHIGSSLGADISQTFDVLGNVAKISLTPIEREGVYGGEASWSATMDYDRQGLEIQRTLSGGVVAQTKRDRLGRVRFQNAVVNELTTHLWREYDWNYDHRLASITDHKNHHTIAFEYDDRGFLERAIYNRKEQVWRTADKLGNLYQSQEKNDRTYQSSQLQHDGKWYYYYDKEGNLILKSPFEGGYRGMSSQPKWSLGSWAYEWNANGSLHKIKRPDGSVITFKYDAFGRRISKSYHRREFLYIWDKNVPLHEIQKEELCEDNIITWIFEGFTPTAKLINGKAYSIISDHIGTPILAVDTNGVKVWERELDIYGRVHKEFTSDDVKDRRSGFMPFSYAGQYYDKETELAYNRFRYYDPNSGNYISQDPIGLEGGNPTLYGYVFDTNTWLDPFGLNGIEWNNGWRTSDGKFASPQGEGISGQKAVDIVREDLSRRGWIHLGDELSVRNSTGQLRRYDLVFRKPDGTVIGVEVKSNTASKTKAQRIFDNGVSKSTPAKGVGKFKGQEIEEVLTVKKVKCS